MGTEKIICDTDVLIDYLDNKNERHHSSVYHIQDKIGIENVLISAITKMEILGGRSKQTTPA